MQSNVKLRLYKEVLHRPFFALIVIVVFGVAVRLYFFNGLYGHDDWVYVFNAKTLYHRWEVSTFDNMWGLRHTITFPILLLFKLFGVSYKIAFVPSLLFSLGSIVIAFLTAKQLSKKISVALLAAFLMAIFPLDVFISTTIRGDVETNFFVGLSLYFYLKWANQIKKRSKKWQIIQLFLTSLFAYLAYMTKDYCLITLVSYGILFIYDTIKHKCINLMYALIPIFFVGLFFLEGLFYIGPFNDIAHRYNVTNQMYSSWIARGDFSNDPTCDPYYSFCTLSNIPTDRCQRIYKIQTYANNYYSPTTQMGLTGYFYYFALLGIAIILLRKSRRYVPLILFMLTFLLYMTFGSMNMDVYQNLHKEIRYFNAISIEMAVIVAQGIYLLCKLFSKHRIRFFTIIYSSILIFLSITGFYALSVSHAEYIKHIKYLPQIVDFMKTYKGADFFTNSVYGLAVDLETGFSFKDSHHWESQLFNGKDGFGENNDVTFLNSLQLSEQSYYIITRSDYDTNKLNSLLPRNRHIEDLLIECLGQGREKVCIYRTDPQDFIAKPIVLGSSNLQGQYLSDIKPTWYRQEYADIKYDIGISGQPLSIGGLLYEHGIATHANGEYLYQIDGKYERFQATIGLDTMNGCGMGSVVFKVFADGHELYASSILTSISSAENIDLDIAGVKELKLAVEDAGDGITCDHATWGEAVLILSKT